MPSTLQQEQVLALISAGSTISDAAQSAGVHRNTIYNWVRSAPAFRLALVQAREAKTIYWQDQSEQLATAALDTIRSLMTDPKAPAGVRLKAAQTILNLATNPTFASPAAFPTTIEQVHNSAQWMPAVEPHVEPAEPLPDDGTVHNPAQPIHRPIPKTGRNDLCPCGSGKKFKRCCLDQPVAAPPPVAA